MKTFNRQPGAQLSKIFFHEEFSLDISLLGSKIGNFSKQAYHENKINSPQAHWTTLING